MRQHPQPARPTPLGHLPAALGDGAAQLHGAVSAAASVPCGSRQRRLMQSRNNNSHMHPMMQIPG